MPVHRRDAREPEQVAGAAGGVGEPQQVREAARGAAALAHVKLQVVPGAGGDSARPRGGDGAAEAAVAGSALAQPTARTTAVRRAVLTENSMNVPLDEGGPVGRLTWEDARRKDRVDRFRGSGRAAGGQAGRPTAGMPSGTEDGGGGGPGAGRPAAPGRPTAPPRG